VSDFSEMKQLKNDFKNQRSVYRKRIGFVKLPNSNGGISGMKGQAAFHILPAINFM